MFYDNDTFFLKVFGNVYNISTNAMVFIEKRCFPWYSIMIQAPTNRPVHRPQFLVSTVQSSVVGMC